jgi:hypothetical protein
VPGGTLEPCTHRKDSTASSRCGPRPFASTSCGAREALASFAEDVSEAGPSAPLGCAEALELLALSEVLARKAHYGRQLSVRTARAAGVFR